MSLTCVCHLSPVSTTRVDNPSWRVTGFHYPSTRVEGPCWRSVNSGSGNRAFVALSRVGLQHSYALSSLIMSDYRYWTLRIDIYGPGGFFCSFQITLFYLQDEPYMMMKENAASLTGNERFEGYVADILRLVADSLGFDYEICLSTDGSYGRQNADGRWNGIIGEVVRGVSTCIGTHLHAGASVYTRGRGRNLCCVPCNLTKGERIPPLTFGD